MPYDLVILPLEMCTYVCAPRKYVYGCLQLHYTQLPKSGNRQAPIVAWIYIKYYVSKNAMNNKN